jgi:hypothetical protein
MDMIMFDMAMWQHFATQKFAFEFGVSRLCDGAIWKRGQDSMNNGGEYLDESHKKSNWGRKKIDYSEKISNMKSIFI